MGIMFADRKKSAKLTFLFVLGTTSVLPTLWGDFVFDDGEAIVRNSDVIVQDPDKDLLWNVFNHDFWGVDITHRLSHKSYRPLTTLSYRLDYSLWGKNPFPFHLIDIFLHGVNCVLVFFFLNKCLQISNNPNADAVSSPKSYLRHERLAYWGALLFSVHPVHVEVLGAVVGRADLLGSLVFLGSFCLVQKHHSFVGLGMLAFFSILGALFKETAISLSVLIIVLGIANTKHSSVAIFLPRTLLKYLLVLVISGSFVLWRLWLQDGPPVFQPYDNPPAFAPTLIAKISSIVYVWVLNVFLLLDPIWLCYDWSMGCVKIIESCFDIRFLLVGVFILICIRLAYLAISNRVILISALIFVSTFLPSSNLLFTVGFVLAERNLYLPSIGYCLFLTYAFFRLSQKKIFIFIIVIMYLKSIQRSMDWMDQASLFKSALNVCPNNAKVHYNLGTMNGDLGRHTIAEKSYKAAIKLRPDYYQAMNNLGNLLRVNGKLGEAEIWLRKAVAIKPDFAAAWMNLGIVLSNSNQTGALHCYRNALKHRKSYPDCEYNLGNLYLDMGDKESALKSWERAVLLKPKHSQAWINSVIMLEQEGKMEEAKSMAIRGLKSVDLDDTLHFILGNILGKLSEFDSAKASFERAISLCEERGKATPSKYFSNLGVLYHRWGKKNEAIQAYQRALVVDPQLATTKKNLEMLVKSRTNE